LRPNAAQLASNRDFGHIIIMRKPRDRQFTVLIERDSAGWFVASVPEFPGCHTQARSLDKLMERIREAIALCIEVERGGSPSSEFIGIQRIAI